MRQLQVGLGGESLRAPEVGLHPWQLRSCASAARRGHTGLCARLFDDRQVITACKSGDDDSNLVMMGEQSAQSACPRLIWPQEAVCRPLSPQGCWGANPHGARSKAVSNSPPCTATGLLGRVVLPPLSSEKIAALGQGEACWRNPGIATEAATQAHRVFLQPCLSCGVFAGLGHRPGRHPGVATKGSKSGARWCYPSGPGRASSDARCRTTDVAHLHGTITCCGQVRACNHGHLTFTCKTG